MAATFYSQYVMANTTKTIITTTHKKLQHLGPSLLPKHNKVWPLNNQANILQQTEVKL